MSFRVDTELITSAIDNLTAAEGRMGDLQDLLDAVHDRVEDLVETGTFRDVWREELGILRDMFTKFPETLTSVAEAYDGVDQDIAASLEPADPPLPPNVV